MFVYTIRYGVMAVVVVASVVLVTFCAQTRFVFICGVYDGGGVRGDTDRKPRVRSIFVWWRDRTHDARSTQLILHF